MRGQMYPPVDILKSIRLDLLNQTHKQKDIEVLSDEMESFKI